MVKCNEPKLWVLWGVTTKTGNRKFIQGLVQFPNPLVDIKGVKYQQEIV